MHPAELYCHAVAMPNGLNHSLIDIDNIIYVLAKYILLQLIWALSPSLIGYRNETGWSMIRVTSLFFAISFRILSVYRYTILNFRNKVLNVAFSAVFPIVQISDGLG